MAGFFRPGRVFGRLAIPQGNLCNDRMKKHLIPLALLVGVLGCVAFWAKAQESMPPAAQPAFEYLSVRYDGSLKTQVFFPDGRVERLHQIIGVKRPDRVDERMWDFNMAMYHFAKSGYEPLPGISRTDLDLSFRRPRR